MQRCEPRSLYSISLRAPEAGRRPRIPVCSSWWRGEWRSGGHRMRCMGALQKNRIKVFWRLSWGSTLGPLHANAKIVSFVPHTLVGFTTTHKPSIIKQNKNWSEKIERNNANYIPKVYLIEFLCSKYFCTITRKSEGHIRTLQQLSVWRVVNEKTKKEYNEYQTNKSNY